MMAIFLQRARAAITVPHLTAEISGKPPTDKPAGVGEAATSAWMACSI